MQRETFTTSMGDHLTVKFVRRRELTIGLVTKAYEPGATIMLPRALAYELVDNGDAVLDRTRPEMMRKEAGPARTTELAASFIIEKAASGRQVRAICSTAATDRHGDVVEPSGLSLKAYRGNPVVLWQHDPAFPIARATAIGLESGRLVATFDFPAEGTSEHADQVWRLIQAGVIRGVSIGFLPTKFEPLRDGRGYHIIAADLLEISIVSIPANDQCLLAPNLLSGSRGLLLSQPRPGEASMAERRAIVDAMKAGPRKPASPLGPIDRAGQLERAEAFAAEVDPSTRPRLAARAAELAKLVKGGVVRKMIGRSRVA